MSSDSLEKEFESIRKQAIKKAKEEKVSEAEVMRALIRKLRDPSRNEKYFKKINRDGVPEEAIEALIGYLYLTDQMNRMIDLIKIGLEAEDGTETEHAGK